MYVAVARHHSSAGAAIVIGVLALALGVGLFLQRRSGGDTVRSRRPGTFAAAILGVAGRAMPLLFVAFGLVVIAIGIDHAG